MPLTERERAVLEFERTWWRLDEPREELIRARFGCTPEAFARELGALVDHPHAQNQDPHLVRRVHPHPARTPRARQGAGR